MIEVTQKEFDILEKVVAHYCVDCPGDDLEDNSICERCHVFRMMEALAVEPQND